jgi:hypothetical protein
MSGVFDPRVFSSKTHNVGGDAEAEEREARERVKREEEERAAARRDD